MTILIRWAAAFLLLAATYNPTPWNYVRWADRAWADQTALVVLAGLVLIAAYVVYLGATLRSIGLFGMLLVGAIAAALIWVLADLGWLSLDNPDLNLWLGLLAVSGVLGVGLGWSILQRRITGQIDIDDTED